MTQVVNVPGVGTLNFPDGMSQADMAAAIQKNFPQIHQRPGIPVPKSSMGPITGLFRDQLTADLSNPGAGGEPDIGALARQQVAQNVAAGDKKIPLLQSEAFHEKSIVPLAASAGALIPGAGWGALALQSLMAGGGAGAGEMIRQKLTREPTDVKAAAKTGAMTAAGTAAGGAVVKGLGAVAKQIFSSPLDESQQQAVQFARDERTRRFMQEGMSKGEANLPFPLSSAAPGTSAGRIQQGSRAFLAGDIKTQVDANKVTQYLNNTVGRMTEKSQVFDDAARQGQQFLREVFEPGEVAIKGTFERYAQAVGDDALVPTTNTLAAAQKAADLLERRGQTTGGLYQRLRTILKKEPGTYTPREFDELYGAIVKQAFTSKAGAGGEGRILLEGITKDMDDFGKLAGVSFADDIAKAAATREQFRELRKIPQLERLSKEVGDRKGGGTVGTNDWMNSLFSSGNGKALAKLRELNPELYHDLADAWLARQIDSAADFSSSGFGRQLNGAKLRTWFEQNQPKIKEIFGAEQAKALDNFSLYAKYMTGAVERSAKGKTFDPLNLFPRAAGEITSAAFKPGIVVGGESASFLLARGLADPNSALFKAFTEGFSPSTRAFAVKSGELAGGAVARGKDER